MAPTFAGLPIFGAACVVDLDASERQEQRIAAPGINGVGSLDLGFRGERFIVRGTLLGPTLFDLSSLELLIRGYRNGQLYTFTDSDGQPYGNCKLIHYRRTSRGNLTPDGWVRRYEATIEHLTPN